MGKPIERVIAQAVATLTKRANLIRFWKLTCAFWLPLWAKPCASAARRPLGKVATQQHRDRADQSVPNRLLLDEPLDDAFIADMIELAKPGGSSSNRQR